MLDGHSWVRSNTGNSYVLISLPGHPVYMNSWPHPNNAMQGPELWSVCVCVCISWHMGFPEHVKASQVSHVLMISSNLSLELCFHAVFHLYINSLNKLKQHKKGAVISHKQQQVQAETRSIAYSWSRHDNKEICHCFSWRTPHSHMQRCLTHPRKSSSTMAAMDRFKLTGLLSELSLLELWRDSQGM